MMQCHAGSVREDSVLSPVTVTTQAYRFGGPFVLMIRESLEKQIPVSDFNAEITPGDSI